MLIAAALVLQALGHPALRQSEVWEPIGPADGATTITVQLKVDPSVANELHRVLLDVSTPGSPHYGNHLTFDELNELVRVPDDVTAAAAAWCDSRGFSCVFAGTGDLLRVTAPAAAISDELGVTLETFVHPRNGAKIVRTRGVVHPSAAMPWADCIMGLNTFPTITTTTATHSDAAHPVTPALLKSMYNITDVASTDSKSSMAVAEFQGQGYLPSDLAKFEEQFNLPPQEVRNITGGAENANKSAGVEAELDIQYIIATGTGVPADFYLHAGNAFDLAGWAASVLADANAALVWSVSYGEGINGGIGGVIQPEYATALNFQLEKFGARGMSVLIASGDSGVYDRKPLQLTKFHPSFPACLPAATAVGSTELNAETGVEDSGVDFSGGGFTPSNYFTRAGNASWQATLVEAYLSSGVELPPDKLWDRAGRGLPDVSAVGVDFSVVVGGQTQGVSGTSASTPTVAGIFALVNDKLMAKGKRPLGFLNPFLYENPGMFHDIVKGYNNGGGLEAFKKGFYATKGWDPVTGLGTPDYPHILAAAMNAAHA